MPKFKVRLESQTDDQSREVTLSAVDADEAARKCERKEKALCAFSMIPPEPLEPVKPADEDDFEAWERYETDLAAYENDLAAHPERVANAEAEIARLTDAIEVNAAGKIVAGPKGRERAHWHAHHQTKPYKVASVEEVELGQAHIERLVSELSALHGDPEKWQAVLDGMADEGIPLNAVTALMYGVPVKNQYDGTAVVDWDTDTIKVALLTAYTANQDTHDFFDDVSATEITGTGYSAGGVTLGSKTITYDTASDQVRMDAADASWTTSTLSATDAVVYKSTGTGSTSPLLGAVDFGATVSTTAGTFLITWDATGIIVIDVT